MARSPAARTRRKPTLATPDPPVSQSISAFAQPGDSFIPTPKATFRPRPSPKTKKQKIKKSQNEVNPTSENYGARAVEKVKFPNELNLTSDKYALPAVQS
jgi:hypothetical protein